MPFSKGSAILWAVFCGGIQLALAGIIVFATYRRVLEWRSARRRRGSGGLAAGAA